MSEMPQELRVGFRRELANMEMLVEQLFGYVVEGIPGATDALLTGDAGSVRALHEREKVIDAVWQGLEAKVNELLLREAPVASDLRYLLTVVRVVPELERSGDLAQHIAVRGTKGLADQLSPRARGLVTRMGDVAGAMWRDLAVGVVVAPARGRRPPRRHRRGARRAARQPRGRGRVDRHEHVGRDGDGPRGALLRAPR